MQIKMLKLSGEDDLTREVKWFSLSVSIVTFLPGQMISKKVPVKKRGMALWKILLKKKIVYLTLQTPN